MTYKGMFFTGAWFFIGGLCGLIGSRDVRFLVLVAIGIGCIMRAIFQYSKFKKSVTNILLLYSHTDEMIELLAKKKTIDEIAGHFFVKYNIYPIDTIRFATEQGGELLASDEDDAKIIGITMLSALYSGYPENPFQYIESFDMKKTILCIDESVHSRPIGKNRFYRAEGTFVLTRYFLYFFSNYGDVAKKIGSLLVGEVPIAGNVFSAGEQLAKAHSKENAYESSRFKNLISKLKTDDKSFVIPLNENTEAKPYIRLGIESFEDQASLSIKWKDCITNLEREYLFGHEGFENEWGVRWARLLDFAKLSQGISDEMIMSKKAQLNEDREGEFES